MLFLKALCIISLLNLSFSNPFNGKKKQKLQEKKNEEVREREYELSKLFANMYGPLLRRHEDFLVMLKTDCSPSGWHKEDICDHNILEKTWYDLKQEFDVRMTYKNFEKIANRYYNFPKVTDMLDSEIKSLSREEDNEALVMKLIIRFLKFKPYSIYSKDNWKELLKAKGYQSKKLDYIASKAKFSKMDDEHLTNIATHLQELYSRNSVIDFVEPIIVSNLTETKKNIVEYLAKTNHYSYGSNSEPLFINLSFQFKKLIHESSSKDSMGTLFEKWQFLKQQAPNMHVDLDLRNISDLNSVYHYKQSQDLFKILNLIAESLNGLSEYSKKKVQDLKTQFVSKCQDLKSLEECKRIINLEQDPIYNNLGILKYHKKLIDKSKTRIDTQVFGYGNMSTPALSVNSQRKRIFKGDEACAFKLYVPTHLYGMRNRIHYLRSDYPFFTPVPDEAVFQNKFRGVVLGSIFAEMLNYGGHSRETRMAIISAKSFIHKGYLDCKDQQYQIKKNFSGKEDLGKFYELFSRGETSSLDYGGALAKVWPTILLYSRYISDAMLDAVAASLAVTHNHTETRDATWVLASIVWDLLHGAPKSAIANPNYKTRHPGLWIYHPITHNSSVHKLLSDPTSIYTPPGSSYSSSSQVLAVVLEAFFKSDSFKGGLDILQAKGTSAAKFSAVYGQVAGAFYGYSHISEELDTQQLSYAPFVELADNLYNASSKF